MSNGVMLHWATHAAPVCACTGSRVTPAQPNSDLPDPSWVPAAMYMENSHDGMNGPLRPTTSTSVDLQVNPLLLDCSISFSSAQDTHHQAQPTASVRAEGSMTRRPSWSNPQGNQWEKRDNS